MRARRARAAGCEVHVISYSKVELKFRHVQNGHAFFEVAGAELSLQGSSTYCDLLAVSKMITFDSKLWKALYMTWSQVFQVAPGHASFW